MTPGTLIILPVGFSSREAGIIASIAEQSPLESIDPNGSEVLRNIITDGVLLSTESAGTRRRSEALRRFFPRTALAGRALRYQRILDEASVGRYCVTVDILRMRLNGPNLGLLLEDRITAGRLAEHLRYFEGRIAGFPQTWGSAGEITSQIQRFLLW